MDLRVIVKAVWLPFVVWLVAVLVVAFGGRQPGVVCVTPMAWLMAIWVGLRSVAYTRSAEKPSRLIEAALAGGIFGLLQGVLFAVIAPFMGNITPEERQKALLLTIVMIVLGALVAAVLSLAIASTQERRRSAK